MGLELGDVSGSQNVLQRAHVVNGLDGSLPCETSLGANQLAASSQHVQINNTAPLLQAHPDVHHTGKPHLVFRQPLDLSVLVPDVEEILVDEGKLPVEGSKAGPDSKEGLVGLGGLEGLQVHVQANVHVRDDVPIRTQVQPGGEHSNRISSLQGDCGSSSRDSILALLLQERLLKVVGVLIISVILHSTLQLTLLSPVRLGVAEAASILDLHSNVNASDPQVVVGHHVIVPCRDERDSLLESSHSSTDLRSACLTSHQQ